MTEEMRKLRDNLAEGRAEQAFGEYSEIENEEEINAFLAIVTDFRLGFDACYKEMQAQVDELSGQTLALTDEIKQLKIYLTNYQNDMIEKNKQLAAKHIEIEKLKNCRDDRTEALFNERKACHERDSLKAQLQAKDAQFSEIQKANLHHIECCDLLSQRNLSLLKEIEAKDAVIDVAVKALGKYKDAAFDINGKIYAVGAPAKEALEQIQKMRGGG